jgi:CheY-like chemotaxis protein
MKKHILIVDDEADIREVLQQVFEGEGYRVSSIATAIEAQDLVGRDAPQLVITDLQLEDSDGLEMIEALKAKLPQTPMMLLTGVFIDPKVVRDTLSHKVAAYLHKTSPLATILSEARRLLGD